MSEKNRQSDSASTIVEAEKSPKISVIVPVYKVEKYLPECIESVLAQTFTDFELILVDDGSPDNSGKICDGYAKKDSRIRVFHKENGGVTSARRLGVENARGEWVMFVDGDDIVCDFAVEILLEVEKEGFSADMVEGGVFRSIPKGDVQNCVAFSCSADEYVEMLSWRNFHLGPCAKLIRRSCFDDSSFPAPHIRWGEDVLMNVQLSRNYRNVKKIGTPLYYYRDVGFPGKYSLGEQEYMDILIPIESLFQDSQRKSAILAGFSDFYFFNILNGKADPATWERFWRFYRNYGGNTKRKGYSRLVHSISRFLVVARCPIGLWFFIVRFCYKLPFFVRIRFFRLLKK